MRNKLSAAVGLLAAAAASAGPAVAADILSARQPPPQPAPQSPPPYVPDWTGLYFGVHGGGGWGRVTFDPSQFADFGAGPMNSQPLPGSNPSGGVFGGQVGYNWQWGSVVGGLEVDFSGADIHQTTVSSPFFTTAFTTFRADNKIDELASARGRLGWLISPNLLAYGTAGIGWGHFRFSATATDEFGDIASQTTFANEFGWVAGAGLEWKLGPNWLLRGEWLHYDFGTISNPHTDFLNANNFGFDSGNIRTSVDVARGALSYKF